MSDDAALMVTDLESCMVLERLLGCKYRWYSDVVNILSMISKTSNI